MEAILVTSSFNRKTMTVTKREVKGTDKTDLKPLAQSYYEKLISNHKEIKTKFTNLGRNIKILRSNFKEKYV